MDTNKLDNGITYKSFEDFFSIDLRSLALLRIFLGSTLITNLILLIPDIGTFLTDKGVNPRELILSQFVVSYQYSIHMMSGQYEVQLILVLLHIFFAFLFLIGYKTKLFSILVFLMLISLNARNPVVLNGGDLLFRILFFWSIFLPLGSCFSIDSALNNSEEKKPKSIFSVATVAIMLQPVYIYFFSALIKSRSEVWWNDKAVHYSLELDDYLRPLGVYLSQFNELEVFLSYFVLYFEIIGPFLFFIPYKTAYLRMINLLLFFLLQLGFGSCFILGVFPWASTISVIPYIPSLVWDKLFLKLNTSERKGLTIYYDGDCGFCKKMVCILKTFFLVPETRIFTTQSNESINEDMKKYNSWVLVNSAGIRFYKFEAFIQLCKHSPILFFLVPFINLKIIKLAGMIIYEKVANNRKFASQFTKYFQFSPLKIYLPNWEKSLATFFLFYTFALNVEFNIFKSPKFPLFLKKPAYIFAIEQSWYMFASPIPVGHWYLMAGKLKNGKIVELSNGGKEFTFEKPYAPATLYKNRNWVNYIAMISYEAKDSKTYLPLLAKYLCMEWNKKHKNEDEKLVEIEFFKMVENTRDDYKKGEVTKESKLIYSCI